MTLNLGDLNRILFEIDGDGGSCVSFIFDPGSVRVSRLFGLNLIIELEAELSRLIL